MINIEIQFVNSFFDFSKIFTFPQAFTSIGGSTKYCDNTYLSL